MKLSTKGRYAVMAMVDLATHSKGQPVALADIAERQEISLSYLEQLFAKLRRGGWGARQSLPHSVTLNLLQGPFRFYTLWLDRHDRC